MASCRWLTDKYIYVLLAGLPLAFGRAGYNALTAAKYRYFIYSTLIWLALILICAAIEVIRGKKISKSDYSLSVAGWAVLAFLLVSTLSAIVSGYSFTEVWKGAGRYDGLFTTLLYGAVFFGASLWGERKPSYIIAFALAMLASCSVAVLQLAGENPLSLYPKGYNYFGGSVIYSGRYLGLSGNVDIMGSLLSLAIPLFFGAYVAGVRKLRVRSLVLLLFSGGMCLFVLLISKVEGALAAMLGSLIISVPVFVICGKNKPRRPQLFAAVYSAAVLICAVAALAAVYNTRAVSGTAYELSRVLRGEISDSFGSSRVGIWRETLALTREYPLLGAGPGTLAARLDIEFTRHVPETGKTLKSFVDNAHNVYLTHLANTGILGLAAYLSALACSAVSFFKGHGGVWRAVFGATVISGCIEMFFGLGLCLSAPLFWLIWGLYEAKDPIAPLPECMYK